METEIFHAARDCGDETITVKTYPDLELLEQFQIAIYSRWYGSTLGGFGATCTFNLTTDEARELHRAIGEWLQQIEG